MSDVEDLADPPSAPKPAPATTAQTETAPGSLPDAAPQGPDQTRPPEQAAYDEDFPPRETSERDYAVDFPARPSPEFHISQQMGVPMGADDPLLSTPMDPADWQAYLNGSRIGRTMQIFGKAFTGPGMTEEVIKWGLATPEEAQGHTDSLAQSIIRPMAQMSRAFVAGVAVAPAALLDAITRGAGVLQDVATDVLPDKLGRDVAAAIDMELTWNGVVPGASLAGPRSPILAPPTRWERLHDMTTTKPSVTVTAVGGVPVDTAIQAERWGQSRLAELEAKEQGRSGLTVSGPEGQAARAAVAPQALTDVEQLERNFLKMNPHGEDVLKVYPELAEHLVNPRPPRQLVEQRAEGIIGEPESNYMGATAPTEAEEAARRAAAAEAPPEPAPVLTVDQVARQQAPELFREYDGLAQRRETLARWVRELRDTTEDNIEANPPAALRAVDAKIDAVRTRMANSGARSRVEAEQRFQAEIDMLEAERDDVLDDLVRQHPDMVTVTRDLQNTDYRMRDLAPEVSRAMRDARDRVPGEPVESPAARDSAPLGAESAPAAPEGAPAAPEPLPGAPEAAPAGPQFVPPAEPKVVVDDSMRAWIAQDVATKLRAVGLSAEEAEANAALVAHRYATRAQLHEGRQGSARELYERDFPHVRIGQRRKAKQPRSRIRELAQRARQLFQGADQPVFYSALTKATEGLKQNKAPADQWAGILRGLKGVKPDEIEWSGVIDWLKEQKGPVTRDQLLDYLRSQEVQVQETWKGQPGADHFNRIEHMRTRLRDAGYDSNPVFDSPQMTRFMDRANPGALLLVRDLPEGPARDAAHDLLDALEDAKDASEARTRYSDYQLPGGENYRELLLTTAGREEAFQAYEKRLAEVAEKHGRSDNPLGFGSYATPEEARDLSELAEKAESTKNFNSSHWSQPNILAHVRLNDRTGPNGERILHVEEIQSDWHQKGRKEGYNDPAVRKRITDKLEKGEALTEEEETARQQLLRGGVPNAPLKNTEQWAGMAVKRILRYAAENGYDGVSWTTGEQQAARYGLEKHVDAVRWTEKPGDMSPGMLWVKHKGDREWRMLASDVKRDQLADYLGHEAAEKLLAQNMRDETVFGQTAPYHVLEGADLKMGGEGMKGFYDQMLPNVIKQVGKKAGVRATEIAFPTSERLDNLSRLTGDTVGGQPEMAKVHYVPLTEDLRELAGAPQPLWQKARDDAKGAYTLATPTSRAIIKVFDTHDASTFAHEMGHHFLEEMRADAALENAPEQIKKDMGAIQEWLKLKPGQDVPTAAHEKWARGFERYLMEGRAPSRALAQVFERFREWLVGIYKTVANLKSNISPEIRDVYARLLAHPRDRVSIDPGLFDEGVYSTPAVLVKKTPSGRADPVAAQLNRETSEQAGVYARELVAELRGRSADAAPAAGGRAPQREGLPGGGAAAGDLVGEAPHVSEPGGGVPGRGDAAPEGFGPPRPAGQLGPNRRQGLYRRIPARPPSLADWLKARGGLKDTKGEVKALGVTKPGLIKAMGGEGLDDAALAAWENGFFPESAERPTIREFLEKLENDLRGNHQWSDFDNEAVEAYRSAREHNAEVDRLAAELQIEAKGLTHGEFWDQVSERLSAEQQARLVESQTDAAREALEEAERLREESLADMPAGWEPPPELGAETRTLEDLENERRQEDAARGAIAGGPDVRGPSGASAGPGGLQEGPGPLGGGARDAGRDGPSGPAAGADRPGAPAGDLGLQPRAEATGPDKRVASPDQPFEELDPEVVDKAGNIRLENLTSDEAVHRVLREYAERNGMFLDARRGVVTDADVLSFAEAMGVEASELNIDHLRKISLEDGIPLAARIQRGRQMLIESAQAVHRTMAGEDELAYLEASQRHLRIQETLSAITAEWGRAGRAFRKSAEEAQKAQELSSFLAEQTGKTLFQVQMEMKLGRKLSTPAQVSKTMREWAKPSNADKVVEVWINGLLSMPATHVANMTSNATMALTTIAETGIAAGIGKVRNIATGAQDRVYFGEAMEQLFGIREGTMEGLRVAAEILKDGDLVNSLGLIEQARPGAVEGMAGKVVRVPGQLLGAEDAVFKAIAYRQKINQLAYRAARREGLEGQQMANRIASLKATPTAEMMTDAVQFARYQTFQKPLGEIGRALQKAMATHPGFKFIVPFMRTPTNIAKYTLERSPLAILSLLPIRLGEEVGANLRGENGAIARDTQAARIILGTSVLVMGYTMAAEGVLVGGRSTNQAQRQADQREGIVPYGIKVGNFWGSINRLGPIGFLLGQAADAWEIRHAATQKEQEDWGKMAMASFITSLGNLASLRGPADFFKFMSSPERSFTSYTSGFVGSFVPSVVAGAGKAFDPYEREARTWLDRIQARVPVARMGLRPKVDLWGQDIQNDGRYGLDIVSPSRISPAVDDPVEREMRRLEFFPTLPSDKIMGVKLTDEQLYEYRQKAGRLARRNVEALVLRPGWKDVPLEMQRKMLNDAFNAPSSDNYSGGARPVAQQYMLMKYQSPDPRNPRPDDIAAAAREQKKKLVEGFRDRIKAKSAGQ